MCRSIVQVDQTTPAHQDILWRQRERGEDPDLDAISIYVLVAIVRKRLGLEANLYQILQILSVTLFEKTPILQALHTRDSNSDLLDPGNQLILFDF